MLRSQSVITSWEEQLQQHQETWEKVAGLELYDTSKQDPISCTQTEMTPALTSGNAQ